MRVATSRAARPGRAVGGCATAALTGFGVFVVVSVIAAVLFMASPTSSNNAATFIQPQSPSLRWDGKSPLTILLMRADQPLSQSPAISSLVLASFYPQSRSATLLSIPSNLWVTIPGYGTGTLGQAYTDGGAGLALLVTQSALHIAIPYYAVVGADTVQQLVSMVGGVSLPTDRGSQQLSGSSVLRYLSSASARQVEIDRNQRFLVALERRILQPQMFFQIPSIVNSLGGSIPTNVPYDQIPTVAHALLNLPSSHVKWTALDPASGAVTSYSNSGMSVMLPDWQRIRGIAQSLVPTTWSAVGVRMVVLNGSDQAGAAARLAVWLRQCRIPVARAGTAAQLTVKQTQVVLAPRAASAARQIAVTTATLLRVPVVTGTVRGSTASVTVLIGHDFQDPIQQ